MTSENLITTKKDTTSEQAKALLQKYRIEKLPVVDDKNQLIGLITVKDIEKAKAYPLSTKDSQGRLVVGVAVGVGKGETNRAEALIEADADIIVVDTAHGHSKYVLDMVAYVRSLNKDIIIVGGNTVTAEATKDLIKHGADVVKVGVGPGSICTTRMVTGVGMPQVTAVSDCAKAAKKVGKTIIADGGIKFSGDITKALAVGGQSVMVGSLLAGCEECPGETVLYQGRTYKTYRGMGSLGAMKKGSKDRYFQDDSESKNLIPEGIEGRTPYRGPAQGVLHQLVGGLRAGMGFLGAGDIEDLQAKASYVTISSQGLSESHVHSVSITREAPNYRVK